MLAAANTDSEAVARARRARFGGVKFLVQAQEEIGWLLEHVRTEQPRRVLEIGTANGGTLYLWTRVVAPDAVLVAVDSTPLGRLGRCSPLALLCASFARRSQRIALVFGAASQRDETRRRVEQILDGDQVDFLFIDGDHSYEGARADFELYSPLVRPRGLVAFHDIAAPDELGFGVPKLWRELSASYPSSEIVAGSEPSYGIGLLRLEQSS